MKIYRARIVDEEGDVRFDVYTKSSERAIQLLKEFVEDKENGYGVEFVPEELESWEKHPDLESWVLVDFPHGDWMCAITAIDVED